MRFLIFLPCFTFGGAEKQAAMLAYRLLELGYEVEAWAFPANKGDAPLKAEMESKGIVCRELPAWPKLDWRFISARSILGRVKVGSFGWPGQLDKLASQIPHSQFDIVVPFTFWPSLVAALLRKRLGASVVVWNHRGGYDDAGVEYSPFLVERIREAEPVFVANSTAGSLFLRDKFVLEPTEVHLISNVFIPESKHITKLGNLFRSESSECQLVQIANFFPEKDFDTLLRAMALLKESIVPCRLHMAGSFPSKGSERHFMQNLQQMGLSDLVIHHGRLDQSGVRALLQQAHIGILSSRSEGCPNSVMEYMHWGLPVVGANIPGIRDLVGEVGADYLFRVGDAFQLKNHVALLANNNALRKTLGKANQERLAQVFGPESVFPQWFGIFFSKSSG